MAIEKKWLPVAATSVTAPGTSNGKLSVTSALGLKVKMVVLLQGIPGDLKLEVKRVNGPTEIELGSLDKGITHRVDLSAYGPPAVVLAYEQKRNEIPLQEATRSTYEEEPTVAWRTIQVDPFGRFYTAENPLPVQLSDGSINIETLNANLSVQLTHRDNFPSSGDVADSIRIGDGSETLGINEDGSINVNIVSGEGLPSQGVSFYDEIAAVATGVDAQIISYTVPALKSAELHRISVNGTNIAAFTVFLNSSILDKKNTFFSNLNENFEFSTVDGGLVLQPGDILSVNVVHERPFVGDFGARIQLREIG